jgi:hypothetical protein
MFVVDMITAGTTGRITSSMRGKGCLAMCGSRCTGHRVLPRFNLSGE